MPEEPLDLAILGAGPTGLDAALAAAETAMRFRLLEAGPGVGTAIRDWGHVRLFSPWEMNASLRMRRALGEIDARCPDNASCPTGDELVDRLLEPLARHPSIAPHLELDCPALAIGREGLLKKDEIATPARGEPPFRILVSRGGREQVLRARTVLDCTGASLPNALGDGGIPAAGERALDAEIDRQIPDCERDPERWRGRTVLLVGAGHSAQTAAVALARLAEASDSGRVIWVLRRTPPEIEVIADDPLPERAALTRRAAAIAAGAGDRVEVRAGRAVEALARGDGDRFEVTLRCVDGGRAPRFETVNAERILALTGRVGDHRLYRQLQVHECWATAGPIKLAASLLAAGGAGGDCLAQSAHGVETLRHPEPGFFVLGQKSYGHTNTFLMRTGFEQVGEVFASLRQEVTRSASRPA